VERDARHRVSSLKYWSLFGAAWTAKPKTPSRPDESILDCSKVRKITGLSPEEAQPALLAKMTWV